MGGTGQHNSVSGAICRDTSCLIFKKLEEANLGVAMEMPLSFKRFVRCAIAFVDDTDFYTNGSEFMCKMQEIMNLYTKLYEATGGKIQQAKIFFYCWRWVYKNGRKVIEEIRAELVVHSEHIQQMKITESTRTLGVHMTPSLN